MRNTGPEKWKKVTQPFDVGLPESLMCFFVNVCAAYRFQLAGFRDERDYLAFFPGTMVGVGTSTLGVFQDHYVLFILGGSLARW